MNNSYTLILNDNEYKIPAYFSRISKVRQEVYTELVNYKIYVVKSRVQNHIFKSFLKYWQDKIPPKITIANFYEYFLLCQEFGLISKFLLTPEYEHLNNISFIKYLTQAGEHGQLYNKAHFEREIAINLDKYLQNCMREMYEIPINSLYNIFFHHERVLTQYDMAYNFITMNLENGFNDRNDLFILLKSLDANELSVELIIDSLNRQNEHFGFIPNMNQKSVVILSQDSERKDKIILNLIYQMDQMKKKLQNE